MGFTEKLIQHIDTYFLELSFSTLSYFLVPCYLDGYLLLSPLRADIRPRAQLGGFGDHHNAVLHHPIAHIAVDTARKGADNYAFTHAHIFIDDGALDLAAPANTQGNICVGRGVGVVVEISAHQDGFDDTDIISNLAAQPDDRIADLCPVDDRAVSQQNIDQGSSVDYRSGQVTRAGVDRALRII